VLGCPAGGSCHRSGPSPFAPLRGHPLTDRRHPPASRSCRRRSVLSAPVLLPVICPACGSRGAAPCARCVASMRRALPQPKPVGAASCVALLDYDGPARELVARFKYRNARAGLGWLAEGMAALVDPRSVDVVTWAPTTRARRRKRGFDQARLLAKAVARRLGVPCVSLLRRKPGAPQTGRDLASRRTGGSFQTRCSVRGRVLLIDDVVTTGATVRSATRALHNAGANEVHVVAAARTRRKTEGRGGRVAPIGEGARERSF
jgi:ComF family protein